MVRLTPEHWEALDLRAKGWSSNLISLYLDCTPDEVDQRIADVARVVRLQAASQEGKTSGQDDSG